MYQYHSEYLIIFVLFSSYFTAPCPFLFGNISYNTTTKRTTSCETKTEYATTYNPNIL